jgi:hypothetical protein
MVSGQLAISSISIRAPLAAVNSGPHLRIYESAVDGGIRETQYDSTWTGGTASNVIATGKIYSPISATSVGLDHIRVYYIDNTNILREVAYDTGRGWYVGDLSRLNIQVAPYSQIASVFLGGQVTNLRVYAQAPNDEIHGTSMTL